MRTPNLQAKIKGKTATRSLILNVLIEEVLTWLDVLPQDADVSVPVGATLFVVEAEGVEQLMLDGAVVQAALTIQRQGLGVTPATHVRVTPACRQQSQQQLHLLSKKKKWSALIFRHALWFLLQVNSHSAEAFYFWRCGGKWKAFRRVCYPLSDMMLRKSLWFVRGVKRMQETSWKDTRPRSMMERSREAEETRPLSISEVLSNRITFTFDVCPHQKYCVFACGLDPLPVFNINEAKTDRAWMEKTLKYPMLTVMRGNDVGDVDLSIRRLGPHAVAGCAAICVSLVFTVGDVIDDQRPIRSAHCRTRTPGSRDMDHSVPISRHFYFSLL